MVCTLILLGSLIQDPGPPERLQLENPHSGTVTTTDAEIHSPVLDAGYSSAPVRGRVFSFFAEASGTYHFDLRSYSFDAYLLARTESGDLLGEDDDGLIGTHARLVLALEAGEEYRLVAAALHGGDGEFQLAVHSGLPPELSPDQRRAAAESDHLEATEFVRDRYGEASIEYAETLHRQAMSLRSQGRFEEVAELFARSLAIKMEVLGADDVDTASAQLNLAWVLHVLGDLQNAHDLNAAALQTWEAQLGPHHLNLAVLLENQSGVLFEMGDDEQGLALQRRALAIRESQLPPGHPAIGNSLNNLGAKLYQLGEFQSAERVLRRGADLLFAALGEQDALLASCLNNLAMTLNVMGHSAEASGLHERALSIRRQVLPPGHPDLAISLNNLGVLLLDLGQIERARPMLEDALRIRTAVFGPNHPATATVWMNLAQADEEIGEIERAIAKTEEAIRSYQESSGMHHPGAAAALNNLANLVHGQGDLERAEEIYRQALVLTEDLNGLSHPSTANSLTNLAAMLESIGQADEAIPLFARALEILRNMPGPEERADTAGTLHALAFLHSNLGQYDRGRELYLEALQIRESVLGSDHPDVALSLGNLGSVALATEHLDEALAYFRRALEVSRKRLPAGHPAVIRSLNNLAAAVLQQGDPQESLRLAEEALRGQSVYLGKQFPTMPEASRFQYLAETAGPRLLLAALEKCPEADPWPHLDAYLNWKGLPSRIQHASLQKLHALRGPGQEAAELRGHLAALQELDRELSRWVLHPGSGADADAHIKRLRGERTSIEKKVNRLLGSEASLAPFDGRQLASRLPAGAVLLDFFIADRVYVWVIRPQQKPVFLALDAPAQADSAGSEGLQRFQEAFLREGLLRGGRTLEEGASSRKVADLWSALWQPLESLIGEAETVFISPDGFLCQLPFGVLRDPDQGYLLEKHRFVYLSDSSRLQQQGRPDGGLAGAALLIGDVDYQVRGRAPDAGPGDQAVRAPGLVGESWLPLTGTAEEINGLKRQFSTAFNNRSVATTLTHAAATEEAVRSALPGKRYLHFATHGYFEPDHLPSLMANAERWRSEGLLDEQRKAVGMLPGLLSGLVLAGVNAEPDPAREDGYLSAEEVSYLDLSECDLAVLSACETALGSKRAGNGLMSLRRAFEVAGARTVVSSLWKVDDRAAATLMGDFYRNYWQRGMDKGEALHLAKLKMLRQARAESGGTDARPETWGAFVLSGDWR